MKRCVKKPLLLFGLVVGFSLASHSQVVGQNFTIVHNFSLMSGTSLYGSNLDGAFPQGGLVSSGDVLYGTTVAGGSFGNGALFKVNADGTGFLTLHNFNGLTDGGSPNTTLLLFSNTLYGTGDAIGYPSTGIVFAVNTDGTAFKVLHRFNLSDGAGPKGRLTALGNTLYGTTSYGGDFGGGTIFAIAADGTGFTNLHHFSGSEGYSPRAGLVASGNTMYGTTSFGGISDNGTVFSLLNDGTSFTTLHNFATNNASLCWTNADGANPSSSLVLVGNTLYGTANSGGSGGFGTVFCLKTNGQEFTVLHNFDGKTDANGPNGDLVLLGDTLLGTSYYNTLSSGGSVFSLKTNGSAFTTVRSFYDPIAGQNPYSGLTIARDALYGTTFTGGSTFFGDSRFGNDALHGDGTVFKLAFQPQLTIVPTQEKLIVTWLTNYFGFDYAGYTLQSTTNLTSPDWIPNSSPPVVVNGQYIVTNGFLGPQQFFRLSQ